jgi:ribonuclease P protein component
MFSQKYRLRLETDVMRAIRSKRGAFDAACGVKFVENALGNPRFVIVVSTKVDKRAVVRNKIRRQYREICKMFIPGLSACDIALLVSKPALGLSFQEMRERLEKTLKKAKLIS